MLKGEYSPTVQGNYENDKSWFESNGGGIGRGNNPASEMDNDGYNKFGYNDDGLDRTGISREDYEQDQNLYNDVLNDFKGIPLMSLSETLNQSEIRAIDREIIDLELQKKAIDKKLKALNEKRDSYMGVNIVESNVISPKRGFGNK